MSGCAPPAARGDPLTESIYGVGCVCVHAVHAQYMHLLWFFRGLMKVGVAGGVVSDGEGSHSSGHQEATASPTTTRESCTVYRDAGVTECPSPLHVRCYFLIEIFFSLFSGIIRDNMLRLLLARNCNWCFNWAWRGNATIDIDMPAVNYLTIEITGRLCRKNVLNMHFLKSSLGDI